MSSAEEDRSTYDPPQRLRRLPSWQINELAKRAQRLVAEALAEPGMRRQHFSVLSSLAEQGPASQAELGRRLWIDRSDLHAILGRLEADGLLARVRDEEDRRRNLVTLTPAGQAALKRLDERVAGAQKRLLEPLSAAERRELRRLLERLVAGARP